MIRERREELTTQILMPGTSGAGVAGEVSYGTGAGLPRDLPLTKLLAVAEGRLNVTVAAGQVLPEAPATFMRNITITGTKVTGGGSITLVNLAGEELEFFTEMYQQATPLGTRRQPSSLPASTFPVPGAGFSPASYDFRCSYIIPIAPFYATHEDEIAGILDPSIFSQLDFKVKFGDATAFSTATMTSTFSAFGSSSGVPSITITRFAPLAANLPINQFHYTLISRQIGWGNIPATATDQLVAQIQPGNKIRGLLFRQYAQLAGVSKVMSVARVGDNASPGIFRFRIKLNGAEKMRIRNVDLREINVYDGGFRQETKQGYALVDWASRGFMEDIFDTRGFGATATRFELNTDHLNMVPSTDVLDITQIEQIPIEV